MTRKAISAENAATVGPYSHGIDSDGLVFLSGQTPIQVETGDLVDGSIQLQTEQCFVNLGEVLKAAGLDFAQVIKVNVFLTDMENFVSMNAVYKTFFDTPYPARTTIGVASLPMGAQVEIEMIARRSNN